MKLAGADGDGTSSESQQVRKSGVRANGKSEFLRPF